MARIEPTFLTGACAVIKIAGKKLAFAKNINYRINVPHTNSKVLGMYESADIQPSSYDASGTFSIHRYIQGVKELIEVDTYHPGRGVHNIIESEGNGVGTFGASTGGNFIEGAASRALYGAANDNFNPAMLMYGTMFDIVIYQVSGKDSEDTKLVPVTVLRNCRLTATDMSIIKREIASQTFQFVANYVDEDSFIAGFSGSGTGW